MILLGLILVIGAVGAGTLLFLGAASLTDTVTIPVLGGSIQLPPLALFLAGAGAMLLLWLGWALVRAGTRRSVRARREAKENARLADEQRLRRERELAEERRDSYRVDERADVPPTRTDVPATRTEGPLARTDVPDTRGDLADTRTDVPERRTDGV